MSAETELAKFLHELGALKRVRRSGWWLAGIRDPESVAEHSFRVAAIAWCLARLEGADAGKAAAMALFHDAGEARVGDLHRLARRYVDWSGVEERAYRDQTGKLPRALGDPLRALHREAREKSTLEARVAKDADVLECLLQAREYQAQGRPVEEWIRGALGELGTKSGRKLGRAAMRVDPAAWRTGRKAVSARPRRRGASR